NAERLRQPVRAGTDEDGVVCPERLNGVLELALGRDGNRPPGWRRKGRRNEGRRGGRGAFSSEKGQDHDKNTDEQTSCHRQSAHTHADSREQPRLSTGCRSV